MTSPIRLGLIGAGNNMLGAHVPRLLGRTDTRIVAIAEPAEISVARLRERYPSLAAAPVYADHRAMLAATKPDAVVISTPHAFHHVQIIDALRAGAHVLCEKPLVCSVAEAQSVIRERDAAGKIVLVSYQRRYQRAFLQMKAAIDQGIIGTVQYVDLQQNQNWYKNQKAAQRWRINKELSGGGQLNDSGSHIIDIMLFVTDLVPERVYATQQNFDLGVDINSAMTITFRGGATGCLSIVGHAPIPGSAVFEDMTIYGSEGAVFYRQLGQPNPRDPYIQVFRFDMEQPVEIADVEEPSTPDDNFLAAIAGTQPNRSPAEGGLRVMLISEAAWKSAAVCAPIDVQALF